MTARSLNVHLNAERAKSGSHLCAFVGRRPCDRTGAVFVHWSDGYPRVPACRQHAKATHRPVIR